MISGDAGQPGPPRGLNTPQQEAWEHQRRQTGAFFVMLGIVMAAIFWIPFLLLRPFWTFFVIGRDENLDRLLIYSQAVIAVPFFVAAAAYSMRPMRSILRSPVAWLVLTAWVGALLWPVIVIDPLRPLRNLPEATLWPPEATVLAAYGDEGLGVGDGSTEAIWTVGIRTVDPVQEAVAWYDRELTARGWRSVGRGSQLRGSTGTTCTYSWTHPDGFALQIHVRIPLDVSEELTSARLDTIREFDLRVSHPSGPEYHVQGSPNACWLDRR